MALSPAPTRDMAAAPGLRLAAGSHRLAAFRMWLAGNWPYPALLLVTGAALWPAWTATGRLVIGGDAVLIHYPYQVLLRNALRSGEPPWWNPYTFGGIPAFATLQAGYGYPLTWLVAWLPPIAAINWLAGLHVVVAALGAAWCARQLGASREGQFVSGAAYALGSVMVARMWAGHLSFVQTNAWLPWATGMAATMMSRRRVAWLAPIMALLILAGQPEILIFSLWWLPLWAAWGARPGGWRAIGRASLLAACGIALGLGLAAFQYLPAVALLLTSNRQAGAPWEFMTAISLPPWHLVTAIAPGLFGDGKQGYLAGPAYEWHERLLYIGVVPLLAGTRATGPWRRWCWLSAGLACALALGRYAPWYGWATALLPGYGSLRIPSKHLALAAMALCLAAGLGVHRLQGRRVSLTCLAAALAVWLASLAAGAWAGPLAAVLSSPVGAGQAAAQAGGALQQTSILLLLAAGAAELPRPWAVRAQALLAALDLVVVLGPFRLQAINPLAAIDRDFLRGQTRAAVIGDGGAIYGNFGPVLGVRQPAGYVSLFSSRYAELLTGSPNPGVALDIDGPGNPALDVLGYGVLLERGPGKVTVTILDPAPPRVWVARCVEPGGVARVRQPDFPRTACITLERRGGEQVTGRPGPAAVQAEGLNWLSLEAQGPGWLVTSVPWYPGWSAWEGNTRLPVQIVDGALAGVPLTQGQHTITMRYTPGWLLPGTIVSLASVVALAAIWWLPAGRRFRTASASQNG